jgi:Xaa-Pro aminopeptidase
MMNKIEIFQKRMPEGVDAFLTTDGVTRFYLTNFKSSNGFLFITKKSAHFYTDFRYIEAAEKECVGCEVSVESYKDAVAQIIENEKIKTISFEDELVTVAALEGLKSTFPSCSFVSVGTLVSDMMSLKTPEEMAKIRKAQEITDQAFAAVLPLLRPDMKETDVAAELEYQMKKFGASDKSFDTIAVSGTNSARPHGVPRPIQLEKGFLTMDFGCIYGGYCSDMTRTVVIGKADADMKKVYDTVLQAQLAAIEAVREGMTGSELDRIARDIIYGAGYEGCFGHGLGHGVGLLIHEPLRISSFGKKPLEKGHVFTVEPGIYLKGKYGVRIEDMIQMTENGPLDITKSPKELIEII